MKRLILLAALSCLLAACSSEKYGSGADSTVPAITVKDVYLDPSARNRPVSLEGIIIGQCGSPDKCWFFLQDDTGRVFVNLKPSGFSLPAAIGRKVKVTGIIQGDKREPQIVAQGVEVF